MIRILKGNHRRTYFLTIAEILHDGKDELCRNASHNCDRCQFADVCDSLMSAEEYCTRLASKMKR